MFRIFLYQANRIANIMSYVAVSQCTVSPSEKNGTSLAFYKSQNGPSLEDSEKSLKRGCRGRPRKSRKRVKNAKKS